MAAFPLSTERQVIMKYREFGNTGMQVSAVSFGAMRLPSKEIDGEEVVQADEAVEIVHWAFEMGVNYIDTGHGYCSGQSEPLFPRFLAGWRSKVYVSTKSPVWKLNETADYRRILDRQLASMGAEYLDVYYFHGLSHKQIAEVLGPLKLLAEAEKAKRDGLIRHIAFSSHDKPENIIRIIDEGWAEGMLVQYNLLDQRNAPAIAHAAARGLGVAIMGPAGGGRLCVPTPALENVAAGRARSVAELALRFVLSNPHVSCALSGIGSVKQAEENAAAGARDSALSVEEKAAVQAAMEELRRLADLYCTGCNYCMPCKQGVKIPQLFELLNYHRVYGLTAYAKKAYRGLKPESRPEQCIECGDCEKRCPQKIEIRKQLKEVAAELGKKE